MARKSINLSKLPPPDLVDEIDFEDVRQRIIQDVNERLQGTDAEGLIDLESEPIVKLSEAFAYREILLRQRVNDAAKGVLLATARGTDLDHLGALLNVERKPGEDDERFRVRIQLVHESFTAAGTAGAYEWHVLDASNEVFDVGTFREAPGRVKITVLGKDGKLSKEALTAIRDRVKSDDVAPLTDTVTVSEARLCNVDVDADLYLFLDPDADTVLSDARAGVEDYAVRVCKIGFDMTTSGLISALHVEGVQHVRLNTPTENVVAGEDEATRLNSISLRIAGRAR